MKRLLIPTLLFGISSLWAQNIIPIPNKMQCAEGSLTVDKITNIKLSNDSLAPEVKFIQPFIDKPINGKGSLPLTIQIDTTITNTQAYTLTVNKTGIEIKAASRQGIFYAIQTLAQLIEDSKIDYINIEDAPRYPYRGMMLDPARHFLPVEDVKAYIDAISRYKFNALHFHLSDDQGWRVEIKKYPLLTKIGGKRFETEGDGKVHQGYYTQEQLKDIVRYAAERYIEVIPEIDVPGHSVAAIAAYPELTCRDTLLDVRTEIGVSEDLLCAGNELVFEMYNNIFNELCDIFPSSKIHIGGDEAPLTNWKTCPKCQKVASNFCFTNNQQLMSYFFGRINETLSKRGRVPMIWYEVDVPNYPAGSIMYAWRYGLSPQVIKECREKGYNVVCAPGEHAYLDYPEVKSDIAAKSSSWIPALPFEKVYQFDPAKGLSNEDSKHIIGVEATIWGEYVPDISTAFFRTFPRAFALAEVGWSQMDVRSWDKFLVRSLREVEYLKSKGINYRAAQQQ